MTKSCPTFRHTQFASSKFIDFISRKIFGDKPDTLKALEDTYNNIAKLLSGIPRDVTFNDPQNTIQSSLNISFVVIDHLYEVFHLFSSLRKDKAGSFAKAR